MIVNTLENGKVNETSKLSTYFQSCWNTILIPHIAASFLPDIFGEGGIVNKIFGEGGTAYGGDGVEETSDDKVSASDEPMMKGIEEGSGLESGTSGGGMFGPAEMIESCWCCLSC